MTAVALPGPVQWRDRLARLDLRRLESELRERVDGEVRFDVGAKGLYATDASNYRQVPLGVVVPRTIDAAVEAFAVCRELDAPVVSRGGGTSLAGQSCNTAVVVDWSKYCHRVVSKDVPARTVVVEPGIVLDELNRVLAPDHLMFGPSPATHSRCTLGGMIGNNSCGATAQAYGTTLQNVRRLEILTAAGDRFWVGPTDAAELETITAAGGPQGELYAGLKALIDELGDEVRRRYPDIPRRISGYNLDRLLPENGFDVGGLVVGSECTLATVLQAELALVPTVAHKAFVALGYPSIEHAADDAPRVARHRPLVLEGMDARLIDFQREENLNRDALDLLPEGHGWLLLELGGSTSAEVETRVQELLADRPDGAAPPSHSVIESPEHQAAIWKVRESGLGATARAPQVPDTWPGWEDSAVPPEKLGGYLRDFRALLQQFDYDTASLYGHFGQGCLHVSIPFDLTSAEGVAHFRRFVREAAGLVVRYGGSLSGEHGDGQARAALLPMMFGERLVDGFDRVKRLFDPEDRMNPGKVVRPYRVDENLRLGSSYAPPSTSTYFGFPDDDGSFDRAAQRCVGVGACRSHAGGVMCPSYRATGDEEHATRGRARLLFEMLNGTHDSPITDGWRSEAVKDALDLCLSCKGCKHDCPVGVDMATYKAEFLAHHYEGRIRPAAHYSMGWLPVWARLASFAPGVVNALTHLGPVTRLAQRLGGVAPDRPVPWFASHRFVDSYRRRGPRGDGSRGEVLLWPDTFTDNLQPEIGKAAVEVLEDAGYRVVVPDQTLCCGLTWISTGQLGIARRVLRRTVDALAEHVRAGGLVVGLEPSCTAVFRSDAPELFPHDLDVARLADQTRTLAELLVGTEGWEPPHVGGDAVVQPHCHQHAVLGRGPDAELMRRAGIDATAVSGCCGLAGNFGYEDGHLDVSVRVAEHELLPAVHGAAEGTDLLADGFSCRTQVEQLTGRRPRHLAEVLADALPGSDPSLRPRTGRVQRIRHADLYGTRDDGWPT